MIHVYLDESGDLGFDHGKGKTSACFTITLLVCRTREAQQGLHKAVRRTLKNKINRRHGKRPAHELKASKTSLAIKEYFLRHVPVDGWELYSVTLNKRRVHGHLRTVQVRPKLYNYLARFILEKVSFDNDTVHVHLTVDRCKNASQREDFNAYMTHQLQAHLPFLASFSVSHEASQDNPCLQAVDLFCGSLARKHERGDCPWRSQFTQWVKVDVVYLP